MRKKLKIFEVISASGNHVGYVKAENKEQAFKIAARMFGGNALYVIG